MVPELKTWLKKVAGWKEQAIGDFEKELLICALESAIMNTIERLEGEDHGDDR